MFIYAVDFDGTLQNETTGAPNTNLIRFLRQKQADGCAVILYTCRYGARLREAVNFCAMNGLRFHAVNENLPFIVKRLGHNPRKILADVYIDDKAIKPW